MAKCRQQLLFPEPSFGTESSHNLTLATLEKPTKEDCTQSYWKKLGTFAKQLSPKEAQEERAVTDLDETILSAQRNLANLLSQKLGRTVSAQKQANSDDIDTVLTLHTEIKEKTEKKKKMLDEIAALETEFGILDTRSRHGDTGVDDNTLRRLQGDINAMRAQKQEYDHGLEEAAMLHNRLMTWPVYSRLPFVSRQSVRKRLRDYLSKNAPEKACFVDILLEKISMDETWDIRRLANQLTATYGHAFLLTPADIASVYPTSPDVMKLLRRESEQWRRDLKNRLCLRLGSKLHSSSSVTSWDNRLLYDEMDDRARRKECTLLQWAAWLCQSGVAYSGPMKLSESATIEQRLRAFFTDHNPSHLKNVTLLVDRYSRIPELLYALMTTTYPDTWPPYGPLDYDSVVVDLAGAGDNHNPKLAKLDVFRAVSSLLSDRLAWKPGANMANIALQPTSRTEVSVQSFGAGKGGSLQKAKGQQRRKKKIPQLKKPASPPPAISSGAPLPSSFGASAGKGGFGVATSPPSASLFGGKGGVGAPPPFPPSASLFGGKGGVGAPPPPASTFGVPLSIVGKGGFGAVNSALPPSGSMAEAYKTTTIMGKNSVPNVCVSISAMPIYSNKSAEELRYEDSGLDSHKVELGLTYVPSRVNGGPSAARKFHLSRPRTEEGAMEEFCQEVSDATGVPLERLVCLGIKNHQVFNVLYELSSKTNSRMKELAHVNSIHIYELEAPAIAQHEAVKMRSAKDVVNEHTAEDTSVVSADYFRIDVIFSQKPMFLMNIGAPVTLTLPFDATCADVHKQLLEITTPMFSKTKALFGERGSLPSPLSGLTPRDLFDVKLVGQYAHNEYDEVVDDDAINLLDLIKAQKSNVKNCYIPFDSKKIQLRMTLTTLGTERFDTEMVCGDSAPIHESQRVNTLDYTCHWDASTSGTTDWLIAENEETSSLTDESVERLRRAIAKAKLNLAQKLSEKLGVSFKAAEATREDIVQLYQQIATRKKMYADLVQEAQQHQHDIQSVLSMPAMRLPTDADQGMDVAEETVRKYISTCQTILVDHLRERLGYDGEHKGPGTTLESLQAAVRDALQKRKDLEARLHAFERLQGREAEFLADDEPICPEMLEKLARDVDASRGRIVDMENMVLQTAGRIKDVLGREGAGLKLYLLMKSNGFRSDNRMDEIVDALSNKTPLLRRSDGEPQWNCPQCTFKNDAANTACQMCEHDHVCPMSTALSRLAFEDASALKDWCKNREGYVKEMLRESFDCVVCMDACCAGGHSATYAMLPSDGMRCGHHNGVCRECFGQYVKTFLDDSSRVTADGIPCFVPGCECVISLENLKPVLNTDDFNKLRYLCLDSAISEDPNSKWCSNPSCKIGVVKGDQGDETGTCPHCDTLTCMKCGGASHPGKSCEDVEDASFKAFVNDRNFKQCPKCKHWVEKRDGCVAMHCRCNLIFCYQCAGVRQAAGTPYEQCTCDGVESLLRAHETMRNHNLE